VCVLLQFFRVVVARQPGNGQAAVGGRFLPSACKGAACRAARENLRVVRAWSVCLAVSAVVQAKGGMCAVVCNTFRI